MYNVTRQEALKIAVEEIFKAGNFIYGIYETLPAGAHVYLPTDIEECWYIQYRARRVFEGLLASSSLICISRKDGRIRYHGSAYDEG